MLRRCYGTSIVIGAVFLLLVSACSKPPAKAPVSATPPEAPSVSEAPSTPVKTAAEEGKPVDGDWLVTRLGSEPPHLNPLTATDAYSSMINLLVFDELLERDNETLAFKPKLAERWEVSDDHLTYTFHLRKDAVFSDGVPLTSADVKFTFDKLMDPAVDAPHLRNYYQDIASCDAVDDYTVRFVCKRPYFKHLTMISGLSAIPKHVYDKGDFNTHPNNRNPVGSGPYVFSEWSTDQQIVLTRNDRYWGEKPHILKRVYKIIMEDNVAFQVLERGELDMMGLRPEQWTGPGATPEFEAKFNKYQWYPAAYSYVGWNMRRPLFEDKRVRRALTMLLDRETILATILKGLGKVITGDAYCLSPEYDTSIQPWPYDPVEAKRLLDEGGWTDSDGDGIRDKGGIPFKFELMVVPGIPDYERLATVYQEELKRAGIQMDIRMLEWAAFLEKVDAHKFDAVILGWSTDLVIEMDPYQVWHSSQAVEKGSNHVGFKNEEADRIMEAARLEFDEAKRCEMYHRFHAILHEEQPYTFLFCRQSLAAVDKRFHNVRVYRRGLDAREWWVPTAEQRYR